jgi:hypothetical protein
MAAQKDNNEEFSSSPVNIPDHSFAQEISTATVVRLLISKGIISLQEILEEEKKTRSHSNFHQTFEANITGHHKNKGIRRLAAKRRWTRRLTSFLFGWQWRKTKTAIDTAKTAEN